MTNLTPPKSKTFQSQHNSPLSMCLFTLATPAAEENGARMTEPTRRSFSNWPAARCARRWPYPLPTWRNGMRPRTHLASICRQDSPPVRSLRRPPRWAGSPLDVDISWRPRANRRACVGPIGMMYCPCMRARRRSSDVIQCRLVSNGWRLRSLGMGAARRKQP